MGPQSISPVQRPAPCIPHPPARPAPAAEGHRRPARVGGHRVGTATWTGAVGWKRPVWVRGCGAGRAGMGWWQWHGNGQDKLVTAGWEQQAWAADQLCLDALAMLWPHKRVLDGLASAQCSWGRAGCVCARAIPLAAGCPPAVNGQWLRALSSAVPPQRGAPGRACRRQQHSSALLCPRSLPTSSGVAGRVPGASWWGSEAGATPQGRILVPDTVCPGLADADPSQGRWRAGRAKC